MPIASLKDLEEVKTPTPAPIQVEGTPYKGIEVDHSTTPVESMVAYIEGMPWSVTYYSQLLGEHNALAEIDPGQNASFQQYTEIKGMELRVDNALTSNYDSDNGITTVSGSSVIPYLLPNVNDYFVAEAGNKELGLFRIKSVVRTTFNRASVYQVEYDLVEYARGTSELYNDIKSKIVRTYFFSKDRLVEGLSPLLTTEDYYDSLDIERSYFKLVQQWFGDFFNRSAMLLLVPGQQYAVYDPRLYEFVRSIIDSTEAKELSELKHMSMDNERWIKQQSLWTMLLDRDYGLLPHVHKEAMLVSRASFAKTSWIMTPGLWNVRSVVYPKVMNDKCAIATLNGVPQVHSGDEIASLERMEDLPFSLQNQYNQGNQTLPLIKSVMVDQNYVLSSDFYEETTSLSVLEILVRDYLKQVTLDRSMLKALLAGYKGWPPLERFYYGPLLMLLAKETIRGYYR